MEEERIIKIPVLGMVVVKGKKIDGGPCLTAIPLIAHEEMFCEINDELGRDDEVIGVLPVPSGTFAVLGLLNEEEHENNSYNGVYEELGFEFRGWPEIDWIEELEEKIELRNRSSYKRG